MDITSLLNAKTPEPEELAGRKGTTAALLHADNRRTISHTSARSHNFPPLTIDQPRPTQHTSQLPSLHQISTVDSNHHFLNSQLLPLPVMQVPRQPYAQPMAYPDPQMMHMSQVTVEQPASTSQGSPDETGNDSTLSKTFICSSCEKSFARRSDLVRHERIHSGVRPHHCDHPGCDKEFIQRSALTVHKRVHTGEKPHKCTSCDKHFSDSSSLARHRRIHTGRRPYKCDVATCQKTFTRKTTLKRHEQQHEAKRAKNESSSIAPQPSGNHGTSSLVAPKSEPDADNEHSEPSGSEHSVQSNTPPASASVVHYQQAPQNYNAMTSYPEAIYASKALDFNPQNVMPESYYKQNPAHLYPSPTDSLRHPGSSMMSYANPGLAMGAQSMASQSMASQSMASQSMASQSMASQSMASQSMTPHSMGPQSSYHTISAPATVYGMSRRTSIHQSPTMYHSPDHASHLAPFQHPQQQHHHPQQHHQFPGHHPDMMNHYPPPQRLDNMPHDQKYWSREGI